MRIPNMAYLTIKNAEFMNKHFFGQKSTFLNNLVTETRKQYEKGEKTIHLKFVLN